jgi:hypothetical protein
VGIEGVNGVAHGLVVAPEVLGDQPGMPPTPTGEQDLAAPPGKADGRSSPHFERLSLAGGQGADKQWFSQAK